MLKCSGHQLCQVASRIFIEVFFVVVFCCCCCCFFVLFLFCCFFVLFFVVVFLFCLFFVFFVLLGEREHWHLGEREEMSHRNMDVRLERKEKNSAAIL